ncbi:MAG: CoA transferase [Dehalococcoidia bacterium]|uniref:CaiB/BaiF CoA transferase family protein n=1 Tax=Candidatus Amarobacter glycogenicus TaxID=3140699 RepID=UPI00313513F5|nr:CoA transferase [Dehalococcoidia bacterium]
MPGPFSGLRVIEFGRFIAAPYCGQLLADGGADVIKVESLDGDETRRNGAIVPGEGRQFLNKNRGKRSLAVDLSDPEVSAAVRALVLKMDVVVANFRPGQARRHGLDYESLSRANPRLIYAENTAYGRNGPMADAPGMDVVLAGYSGLLNITADGPMPPPEPIIDYTAGLLLAWGVSTALYTRERTGKGQRLDVALLQAALVLQNNHINHVDVIDNWREEFVEYLKHAFAGGASWADVLAKRDELQPHVPARVYYGFLRTSDGMISIAAMARPLRMKMMEVVGFDDRWSREPGWEPEDARAYTAALYGTVEEILRTDTTENWHRKLSSAGIPCGPMRLREQLLDDEQVRENGFVVRMEHATLGGLTVVAPPVAFSETPLTASTASPQLGQHTREVLLESGLDAGTVDRLAARGAIRSP